MKRRCTAVSVWRDKPEQETAYRWRCSRTLTGDGRGGLCHIHQAVAARQPVRVAAYGGDIRIMLTSNYRRAVVMYDSRLVSRSQVDGLEA